MLSLNLNDFVPFSYTISYHTAVVTYGSLAIITFGSGVVWVGIQAVYENMVTRQHHILVFILSYFY